MDRETAISMLRNCHREDTESAHGHADEILCDLLTQLGYADVVEEWQKVPKWYA